MKGSLDVYVITSASPQTGRGHLEVARAALEGGATALQMRAPELDDEEAIALARALGGAARERRVPFIVNDRIEVALRASADGVHLGQDDRPSEARQRLRDLALGVSVADPQEALAAHAAGADYLGVTVWPTPTKPEAFAVGIDGLRAICAATPLPVVGVGGIDASNAAEVVRAGAAGVAVVSAVAAAPDPVEAVRKLVEAVQAARKGV